jgi:Bacterial Ig-like domain (group 3)
LELTGGFVSALQSGSNKSLALVVFVSLSLIAFLVGMVLWFRWVYQIHNFLRTIDPSYPVSPGKAVGYQFIPFFSRYWDFKWTNRISDFVRRGAPGTKMSKGWLGLWLMFASLLLMFDRSLELFALFGISAYLARKINRVPSIGLMTFAATAQPGVRYAQIGPPRYARIGQPGASSVSAFPPAPVDPVTAAAWDLHMTREWKLPVSAGIGAAFGFLMCYGFWFLLKTIEKEGGMWEGLGAEAFKILLVAAVLYFYLEPLSDKLLTTFHVVEEHHAAKVFWKKIFHFGVIVVIVDVAHSLLERAAQQTSGASVASVGILLTLFFGGMTYLWICGAPKRLRDAIVLVGPGTVLLLMLGAVVVAEARPFEEKLSETASRITAIRDFQELKSFRGEITDKFKDAPSGANQLAQDIVPRFEDQNERNGITGTVVLGSALFVALAGFIAMRNKLGPLAVAGTVFAASLLSAATLVMLIPHPQKDGFYIVITLWSAFWWCLGMLAFYDHDIFHSGPELTLTTEERSETQFTPAVWLVSSLILVGLIAAAYIFRPQPEADPATTSTSLISSDPVAEATSPVTFTATISDQGAGAPSGVVNFYADGNPKPLGTSVLSNRAASFTASGLPTGTHLITARYSGDENFSSSTSAAWRQEVIQPHLAKWNIPGPPSPHSLSEGTASPIVIPQKTPIYVANIPAIDSNIAQPSEPIIATLAAPIVVDGRVVAQKGSMAILGVSDIDRNGSLNGKPALTIHLMKLQISGQIYEPGVGLRMQGTAFGSAGRVYIPSATILTFNLRAPITTDIPRSSSAGNR